MTQTAFFGLHGPESEMAVANDGGQAGAGVRTAHSLTLHLALPQNAFLA